MNKHLGIVFEMAVILLFVVAITIIALKKGDDRLMSQAAAAEGRMLLLKGGSFLMGATGKAAAHRHTAHGLRADVHDPAHDVSEEDESPAHRVTLSPFYLDVTEVTNEEFAQFVTATHYKTLAEKQGSAWVFQQGQKDWKEIQGADWRHPLGPDSTITNLMNHPVVNVSWHDAAAYAKWAGKRLPTEAEWEYAARGGREGELYPWGNQLKPQGKPLANFWQGVWPNENKLEDKFYYTAPVSSFAPNDFGIYDLIGNVWEWTADWYGADYYAHSPTKDPKGPRKGEMKVARGGSWFCSENYCGAYRVGFRGQSPTDSGFNNVGFRCARNAS